MKSIFFTFFYHFLFVLPVFSQDIISDNKQWNIEFGVYNGVDNTYTTSAFRFNVDTIIDNIRYAKLYVSDNEDFTDWQLYAFMREDGGKLIRRDLFAIDENVVADFDIQLTDTFVTEDYSNLVVESVTHEEWGGKVRKIITLHSLESPNNPFLWIEGVGNNRLFARSGDILSGGWSYTLLCFTENGQLVYQNPKYNSCKGRTNLNEILDRTKDFLQLFGAGHGIIELKSNAKGTLTFYTPDGRLVYKGLLTQHETTLSLPCSGLLFYRFATTNGEVQSGKVVVH